MYKKQNIILREYDILNKHKELDLCHKIYKDVEGGNHRIDNVYILQYWRKDTL